MLERAVSLVAVLFLAAAIVALAFLRVLFAHGPVPIALQVLAIALLLWARVTFGLRSFHAVANPTEGGLVTRGPYRFIRHPIYAAVLLFTAVGVLSHPSAASLSLGAVVVIGTALRIWTEERLVTRRYPEYVDYAKHTRRLVPYLL